MARSIFRGNMTLSPNWLAPGPPFLLRRSFLLQGSCERRGKARQRAEEHWVVGGEGEFRIWNDVCKEWIKHPAPLPKGLSWPMILVIFEYKLWDCEHAGSLTKHWKGRQMPSALRSELCSVLYKSLHTSWYLMISASIGIMLFNHLQTEDNQCHANAMLEDGFPCDDSLRPPWVLGLLPQMKLSDLEKSSTLFDTFWLSNESCCGSKNNPKWVCTPQCPMHERPHKPPHEPLCKQCFRSSRGLVCNELNLPWMCNVAFLVPPSLV